MPASAVRPNRTRSPTFPAARFRVPVRARDPRRPGTNLAVVDTARKRKENVSGGPGGGLALTGFLQHGHNPATVDQFCIEMLSATRAGAAGTTPSYFGIPKQEGSSALLSKRLVS